MPLAAGANEPAAAPDGRPTTKRGLWARLAAGVSVAWAVVPHVFGHATEVPRASVTYQVYNQDSVLVDTQVRYLEPEAAQNWQQLVVGGQAGQDGYVVVSVQNASPRDVWFDDAAVRTTTQELVVQENHYDPWGQNLVDLEVAGTPNEVFQYSGKERIADAGLEWVDHGARYYDAQLGRWHVPDPANQFASPYMGMGNNPVSFRDPDGQWIHILIGAVVGGILNTAAHWDKIHSFKDGAAAFGIGAAGGALVAATGGAAIEGLTAAYGAGAASTIGGGAYIGAVSSAVGSYVQGVGNSAYFNDPYSVKQWGRDVLIGAAVGGTFNALAKGVNYLKGRWSKINIPEDLVSGTNSADFPEAQFPGGNRYDAEGFPIELKNGGYQSFDEFKEVYGTAGKGMAWHHIVEQRASNVQQFGSEAIQHPTNLVRIPHGASTLHNRISGFYSSKQAFTNGLTVRQWLNTKNYNEQYRFGISILKQFGWNPSNVRW